MLRAFIIKELRHHLVSFRYLVSTVILLTLTTLAVFAASDDYRLRLRSYQDQVAQHREDLRQVRAYSFLQPVLDRAPEPLGVIDRGVEGQVGNRLRVGVFTIPAATTGAYRDNPFMAAFPSLDLTTIVRVVLALLALLLTFDTLVGEREQGTLRLVMANPVGRRTVLAGKYLGALLALLVPLLLALLTAVTVLVLRGGVSLDLGHWLRLAAVAGAYVLYLSLMILLGLVLSATARSAAKALAAAILGWLLLVFLIPQVAIAIGTEVAAVGRDPRAVEDAVAALVIERDTRLDEALRAHPLRAAPSGHSTPFLATADNRAVLHRYGSAAYYDALVAFHRQEVAMGQGYAAQIYALRQAYEASLRSEERLAAGLASLSPSFLLARVSASFAGTSIADHDAFLRASRAYREALVAYLEEKGAFDSWRWFTDDPPPARPWPSWLGLDPEDVDANNIRALAERFQAPEVQARIARSLDDPRRQLDLDDLPVFRPPDLGVTRAASRVVPEITVLLLLNLLLAATAWRRVRGYDLG